MKAALSIERLSVDYGASRVLRGIDLSVRQGEYIALLGASGCGKTTLLRAIAGFVPVAEGRIRAGGRDITHAPPEARGNAMVFQSYALWPHMTVARNIGYGLKLRGWDRTRIATRVTELLALLRLEGLGERLPAQLSGGQRQRVALGRALAVEPGLLLLDEPMSNLDARVRESLRHELRALQRQLGLTAIHVTHDREEAMMLADRILLLKDGVIEQEGPPEALWTRPASPYVADFLGATNDLSIRTQAGKAMGGAGGAVPCGLADGAARLLFRPDEAIVPPPGEVLPEGLLFGGRVRHVTYPGGGFRVALEVGGQQVLADAAWRPEEGSEVRFVVPETAAHIFAATQA